jgi:hypothetical protein
MEVHGFNGTVLVNIAERTLPSSGEQEAGHRGGDS